MNFRRPFMLSVMFFLFGSQMDLTDAILESFPDDSPELRGLRGENRGRLADEKAARGAEDAARPDVAITEADAAAVLDATTSAKDDATKSKGRAAAAIAIAERRGARAIAELPPHTDGACASCGDAAPLLAWFCHDTDCDSYCALCALIAASQPGVEFCCPSCETATDRLLVDVAAQTFVTKLEAAKAASATAPAQKRARERGACSHCQTNYGVHVTGHNKSKCRSQMSVRRGCRRARACAPRQAPPRRRRGRPVTLLRRDGVRGLVGRGQGAGLHVVPLGHVNLYLGPHTAGPNYHYF